MAQSTEDKPASRATLADRIAEREADLEKLMAEYKKNPSAELQADVKRKSDTLLHLKNMAKGDPRARAQRAAEAARAATMDRAIKHVELADRLKVGL